MKREFKIGNKKIGINHPTYFIADIAANHDGDLSRAIDLIWKSKEAGADCAKFQHFEARKIVSDYGFSEMKDQLSHQASWSKSVFEVYDQYHTKKEWTEDLISECKKAEIEFMTTPYDFDAIELFSAFVPAFKIGSGDITFLESLKLASKYKKPILLATGASDLEEVKKAVDTILALNDDLCLMQCNTNYTGNKDNFNFINLNVLKTFESIWPDIPLGLSDHTHGHSAVLGAISLGARVIEKHFTDDNEREGPDHKFAMNPSTWSDMVKASRELECSLGDGVKRIEENEKETVFIQRRALRANKKIKKGELISKEHLDALRPCNPGDCSPADLNDVLGKKATKDYDEGESIKWANLE